MASYQIHKKWCLLFPRLALNIKRETHGLFLKKQIAKNNNTIFEGIMEDWGNVK